jgi:hypothetical protein
MKGEGVNGMDSGEGAPNPDPQKGARQSSQLSAGGMPADNPRASRNKQTSRNSHSMNQDGGGDDQRDQRVTTMATIGSTDDGDTSRNPGDGKGELKERSQQKRGFLSSLFGCWSKSAVRS